MITIHGIQYPNTKEFTEMTGIPEGTLWKIAEKYPELTIKFFHSRLWLVGRFDDERSKSGFKSYKKKRRTGQLTKGN